MPLSETFIYNGLVHLKRYQAHVLAKRLINTEHFPFPSVHLFKKEKELKLLMCQINPNLLHVHFGTSGVELPKVPNAELKIIGSGSCAAQLRKIIKKLNLRQKVKLLGDQPHDRVVEEIQAAHLFCLASIKTKSGNIAGIPGGIPELISHRQEGLLAKQGSAERSGQATVIPPSSSRDLG